MGGVWVPHTIPQVLAAASVFLANVSEDKDPSPCLMLFWRGAEARHLWRFLDHQTNARLIPTPDRSA